MARNRYSAMQPCASARRSAAHVGIVFRVAAITFVAALAFAGCSSAPGSTAAPSTSQSTASTGTFEVSIQARDTVVKLSWASVPNAAGYLVFRDGSRVPLNPKPITDPTYEDIGLTNGRTYTYVVVVVDKGGNVIQQSAPVQIAPKAG